MARNCCQFFTRGTTLVLLMNGLLNAASLVYVLSTLPLALPEVTCKFSIRICTCCSLGIATCDRLGSLSHGLGRYRAIAVGLVLSSVTILTVQAAFIMLQFDWTPIPAFVLIVVGLGNRHSWHLGASILLCYRSSLDQMIGASAEELSAAVQWYCWGITSLTIDH